MCSFRGKGNPTAMVGFLICQLWFVKQATDSVETRIKASRIPFFLVEKIPPLSCLSHLFVYHPTP